MQTCIHRTRALASFCVWFAFVGCGRDGEREGALGSQAAASGVRTVRSEDPRVQALRAALEDGWLDVARELYSEVASLPELGVEAPLLRARLALLQRDPLGASQAIEEARAAGESDGRVWATAAEIAAMDGRFETALQQLQEGKARFGETPEMLRAEGVCTIFRPGLRQGKRGVDLLEKAREMDPSLPFVRMPLSEAHRLLAQQLAGTDLKQALVHGERALEYAPDNQEARELLGDLCMSDNRWGKGIELFESLLADGRPIESKVRLFSKQAGVVALTQGDRPLAIKYFARARALGLSEEELGTGAMVLQREATEAASRASQAMLAEDWVRANQELAVADQCWPEAREVLVLHSDLCVHEGLVALQTSQWAAAQERFERALEFDSESLVARHLLGRVQMEQGHFEEAAAAWYRVVDEARQRHVELPDPVHLSLANALALAGKPDEARNVLQVSLDLEPTGPYVEATRQLLHQMDNE